MPNSDLGRKAAFFRHFNLLYDGRRGWEAFKRGQSRATAFAPRPEPWPEHDFLDAFNADMKANGYLGAATGDDRLKRWRRGERLPKPKWFASISRVFFPTGDPELSQLSDLWDAAREQERLEAAEKKRGSAQTNSPARSESQGDHAVENSPVEIPSPPIGDTVFDLAVRDGGHDIRGMVEFTLDPPRSWQDPPGAYALYATLGFAPHTDMKSKLTASLSNAYVMISGQGYQVASGTRIGCAQRPHDCFDYEIHGSKVKGPPDKFGRLNGEALPDGEHIAVVYAISAAARDLTVRVSAHPADIRITLPRDAAAMPVKEQVNKLAVMKGLLKEHYGFDEDDRVILAERHLVRSVREP